MIVRSLRIICIVISMFKSPSQFYCLSVNDVKQCGCWHHHFLLLVSPTGGHFVCACVSMGCWSAAEAFSVNYLRSVPAFAGCFLELNDVYWMLRSTNMFFKVSRYFSDETEYCSLARCHPWEESLSFRKIVHQRQDGGWMHLRPNISRTFFQQEEKVSMIIFR